MKLTGEFFPEDFDKCLIDFRYISELHKNLWTVTPMFAPVVDRWPDAFRIAEMHQRWPTVTTHLQGRKKTKFTFLLFLSSFGVFCSDFVLNTGRMGCVTSRLPQSRRLMPRLKVMRSSGFYPTFFCFSLHWIQLRDNVTWCILWRKIYIRIKTVIRLILTPRAESFSIGNVVILAWTHRSSMHCLFFPRTTCHALSHIAITHNVHSHPPVFVYKLCHRSELETRPGLNNLQRIKQSSQTLS